jgi:predicted methyltransferase
LVLFSLIAAFSAAWLVACSGPSGTPTDAGGPDTARESGADAADVDDHDAAVLAALEAAVARPERPERERARDAGRKPVEVLHFCGVEPGAVVLDIIASVGYYAEILAHAVGPEGRVYGHNSPDVLDRFAREPWAERLERLPDNVVRLDQDPEDIAVPEPVDVAYINRYYHDWYWIGIDREAYNRAVYEALKPGGIYCVIDHHAEEGSGARDTETLHRVDAAMVREEIEAAGFVFEAESDVLRNPDDDRTWNVFIDDRSKRDATDRFVYRFRKPE